MGRHADEPIAASRSQDGGRTWGVLGEVPVCPETDPVNYHEPHVVELPSGRLIGVIRIQDHSGKDLQAAGIPTFSIVQTESDDGGQDLDASRGRWASTGRRRTSSDTAPAP